MGHAPSTAGTFWGQIRKNSGKTPEALSELLLEFPSRVRPGTPPNPIIQGISDQKNVAPMLERVTLVQNRVAPMQELWGDHLHRVLHGAPLRGRQLYFTLPSVEVPWTWEKESRGSKPKSLKKVSKKSPRPGVPKV